MLVDATASPFLIVNLVCVPGGKSNSNLSKIDISLSVKHCRQVHSKFSNLLLVEFWLDILKLPADDFCGVGDRDTLCLEGFL